MSNKNKETNYNPISLNNLVHGFKKGMTPWNKGIKGLKLSDGLKKWRENGGVPWNKGMKGFMKGEKMEDG